WKRSALPKAASRISESCLTAARGRWSLAALDWDGTPSLGIRRNGDSGNPIGNPQSRGIPTRFILPPEVADTLSNQFVDTHDQTLASGSSRGALRNVRIRDAAPQPRKGNEYGQARLRNERVFGRLR